MLLLVVEAEFDERRDLLPRRDAGASAMSSLIAASTWAR